MRITAKTAITTLAISLLVAPMATFAHVKWFVTEPTVQVSPFRIAETAVMVWTACFVLALIVAWVLQRHLTTPARVIEFGRKQKNTILWIVNILFGLWLLINSFSGTLFIPTLELPDGLQPLLWLQGITGVTIAVRQFAHLSSMLLVVLYITGSATIGWLAMTEHLFILGIALWLQLQDEKHPWHDWGLPLLRLSVGISLVVLGFQEKLLQPNLAAEFLSTHNWNFMQTIGMTWFDNRLFILSAGMSEVLFGILFILGLITRLNTLALAVFLLSTAATLGITEVFGHLPIFAVALLFIVYGAGEHLVLTREPKRA